MCCDFLVLVLVLVLELVLVLGSPTRFEAGRVVRCRSEYEDKDEYEFEDD
jgi:hypothetical protein